MDTPIYVLAYTVGRVSLAWGSPPVKVQAAHTTDKVQGGYRSPVILAAKPPVKLLLP